MKKIVSIVTFSVLVFWINIKTSYSEEKYFVVTAYYSPLPDQDYYMRGTLEKEKILQWNWTHWASWKNVFSWMLAAPKDYDFWTKIYLEWLWVWVVEDRWQAIVKQGERWYNHDRLDVWMWYWDEWLKRALAWWKRTVKWEVLDNSSSVTIDYKAQPAPDWAVSHLTPVKKEKTVFDLFIWKDSPSEDIKKLQEFFSEIWLYSWKLDWIYNDEMITIVFDFQLANSIVASENDVWAWYWWEKTKQSFKEKYNDWVFVKKFESTKDWKKAEKQESFEVKINETDLFSSLLNSEENIEKLENIFKDLWIYNWEITWKSENIKKIILDFQLKENIVSKETDSWAWTFWPKTRASLKAKYEEFQAEKAKAEKRKNELKAKYKEIEESSEKDSSTKVQNILKLKKWEVSAEVRELQEVLTELWYFSEKTTWIYWDKTFDSVVKFQLDNELINSKNNPYAWIIWEKTLSKLKEKLFIVYKNQKLSKENISEDELKEIL